MRAARAKTLTSASKRTSVVAAIDACNAVIEYTKDLEKRIEYTAKRYANFEALSKQNYELLQQLEEFKESTPQTLRATQGARMQFWTQPNSNLKRAFRETPLAPPQKTTTP